MRRTHGGPMSRDEILTRLYSLGAISLVRDIQEIEAGRIRRIALPHIPGGPEFSREVMNLLRCLGAEVDLVGERAGAGRLRRGGQATSCPSMRDALLRRARPRRTV